MTIFFTQIFLYVIFVIKMIDYKRTFKCIQNTLDWNDSGMKDKINPRL